jgi:hypothetical protein
MKVVIKSQTSVRLSTLAFGECFQDLDQQIFMKTDGKDDGCSYCIEMKTGCIAMVDFDENVHPVEAHLVLENY